LYATGTNARIVAIDVSGASPMEASVVGAGTVATLLTGEGISDAPQLSGLAVFDAQTLLVIDQTSNTILSVDRLTPDSVQFFAGEPSTTPGFADGLATGSKAPARFSFGQPTQLAPSGDASRRVFVADVGNHAVRVIDALGRVITVAGRGTAF